MSLKDTRKNHLMENIARQYKLLHEYETRRDLSDRPKEVELAGNEIKAIILSLEDYIGQYDQICQEEGVLCPLEIASISKEIRDMKQGQQQIMRKQDETLAAIDHVRDEISMKLDQHYRGLALSLMSVLSEQEMRIVGTIIDGIDSNKFSERQVSELLAAIQAGYGELVAKSVPLVVTSATEEARKLPEVWNSQDVSAVGKLKLSIPLIPTILTYETELSFSVKQSLSALWQRYFKGKQVLL